MVTNNVAEYKALLLGLRYALMNGFKRIDVQGDSMLVVMQVLIFIPSDTCPSIFSEKAQEHYCNPEKVYKIAKRLLYCEETERKVPINS